MRGLRILDGRLELSDELPEPQAPALETAARPGVLKVLLDVSDG